MNIKWSIYKIIPAAIVILVILLSGLNSVQADTITLKSGRKLEGTIGARSRESILINIPGEGSFNVPRSTIAGITENKNQDHVIAGGRNGIDDLVFLSRGAYYKRLKKELKKARKSIEVMMFFVNYQGRPRYPANELVNLLVKAHERGVEVKVLLETSTAVNITEANRRAGKYLKSKGVDVKYFPVYPIMHVKMVIIDDNISIIGSHNWTLASTRSNVESSVLVKSERVARQCESYFRKNYYQAHPAS